MRTDNTSSYDLIAIGTSFGSSFFLAKYLELVSPKARVLVLERGQYLPQRERLARARARPRYKVGYISSSDPRLAFENENPSKPWFFDTSFGGGSNAWTGCTPRPLPNDFKLKSTYAVGQDWPLGYDDLEPYYCEAEAIMSIAGPEITPYRMSKPYPLPPHHLSTVDTLMQKAYGPMYISQPTTRSSINGKRNQCCSSAICHICPMDAKFTIDNSMKWLYEDPRISLSLASKVIRLETRNDHVQSVVFTRNGRMHEARGDVIVLGANPIFNAHILLSSGDTNSFTGHFLSEQVGFACYVYLDGLENKGGTSFISANGYMLYDTPGRNKYAGCLIESHNSLIVRHEQGKWRQIAKFKFVFEDVPLYENCVKLGEDPARPVVSYSTHSDYVTRSHANASAKLADIFHPLPVESIHLDDDPTPTEGHILGTTRMSDDPSNGVVDKHLIHHQFRNLFVVGASTFPTLLPANPTLTLSALSLRTAQMNFGA